MKIDACGINNLTICDNCSFPSSSFILFRKYLTFEKMYYMCSCLNKHHIARLCKQLTENYLLIVFSSILVPIFSFCHLRQILKHLTLTKH